MVQILALWLPILVAAVLVFVGSSIIHMFLGYQRTASDSYLFLPVLLTGSSGPVPAV
ncbi:MAG: hypothetical protein OXI46_06595 [Gemmatimonadota bacterium]|nr:hypothetical protein [Gemmatimonadota bacterium]